MKTIITSSLAGVLATAISMAAEPAQQTEPASQNVEVVSEAHASLLNQISKDVSAQPEKAAEMVKQAILNTKADVQLVLQIVKTAVTAAPEQAEAIRKVAIALAPDAEQEVEVVIAMVLNGDQVAAAPTGEHNASREPKGKNSDENTVWLSNKGALQEGKTGKNNLGSKVQDYASSVNANHNQGSVIRGGGTVIVIPPTTSVVIPPP